MPALSEAQVSKLKKALSMLAFALLFIIYLAWIARKGASSGLFLAFAGINALLIAGLCITLVCLKEKLEKYYLVVFGIFLVLSGLVVCAMLPPGTAPDEAFHYRHAYQLASVLAGEAESIASDGGAVQTGFWMRAEDLEYYNQTMTTEVYYGAYSNSLNALTAVGDPSLVFFEHDAYSFSANPPQTHILQVAGILLARLLNLNAIALFYCGRLFGFALFCACVIFAVKVTPVGKPIFMAIALLPITLQLGMSYSYDGAIIAFAFLLTALLLRAIYAEKPFSVSEYLWIALAIILLAPCKMLYSGIVLLALLIPAKRFSSKTVAYVVKGSFFLVAAAAIVCLKIPDFFATAGAAAQQVLEGEANLVQRGDEMGEVYTLSFALSHPLSSATILLNTIFGATDGYIFTGLGGSLGWLQPNLVAPWWVVIGYVLCLFVVMLRGKNRGFQLSTSHKVLFVVIFVLGFLAIEYAFATTYSFVGEEAISGIQGRYFLPLLPLLLLALQPNKIQIAEGKSIITYRKALVALLVLNCVVFNNLAYHAILGIG